MNLSEKCDLSYYVPVAPISREHGVWLCQHAETGEFYVRKTTRYYNLSVFRYLMENPVPDMPRLYGIYEEQGGLTVVEEYITGETLENVIAKRGTVPEREAAEWIHALCVIVGNLHRLQPPIIHRDIKPSNIILTPDGRIKLLDLGAARQAGEKKSQDTVIIGTAGYAAPEQYGFSSTSVTADIYSIGVLLNKLLTGRFPGEQQARGDLGNIIRRCTQMDPANRYSHIGELDRDVRRFLGEENPSGKTREVGSQREPHQESRFESRFLPPGLRSGSLLKRGLVLLVYLYFLRVLFTMDFKLTSSGNLTLDRFLLLGVLIGMVLISGNYLGCHRYLPLARSGSLPVKILGICLWNFALLFAAALLIALLGLA